MYSIGLYDGHRIAIRYEVKAVRFDQIFCRASIILSPTILFSCFQFWAAWGPKGPDKSNMLPVEEGAEEIHFGRMIKKNPKQLHMAD